MNPRAERLPILLLVLVLHAALLALWRPGVPTSRDAVPPVRAPLVVRLLEAPRVARSEAAAAQKTATATPAPKRVESRAAVSTPQARAPSPETAVTTAAPASRAEPAAPTAAEPALDLRLTLPRGMAERGVLTEPPGSARKLALNDPRANARPDPSQQLPDDIARAGKGDCLKGDYAFGGMGLLSLPFLAYAAAAGHCKPQR